MPAALVECIPNFSEARRPEVIAAIREAMAAVPGAQVLDVHSDLDHNRSVITFVGPPDAASAAAYAGIKKAVELINLDEHRGEHPRIGAADVVPFVPLSGITLAECVALAKALGERVGRELGIPVYLYEAAATRPERQNLENVRRGEYEKLKTEIGRKPERKPDFGPERVGPAGAVVIGARAPLIAYNVYLNTADVSIAKKVAAAVRHSSGGLRYVKGLGLLVNGQAQVSVNLTDFTKTPLARVVEFVRREAARYGASITRSELVGLIPQAALVDAAQWYLQLDGLESEQILENRLREISEGATTPIPHRLALRASGVAGDAGDGGDGRPYEVEAFVVQLAAGTATPGGGAAAAQAGAMSAALIEMVARLTIGKKAYAGVEAQMQVVLESAAKIRSGLLRAVEEDSAAFEAVLAAFKLQKASDEEKASRAEAIEAAYHRAAEVPMRVGRDCAALLGLAAEAASKASLNALSDAGTSAHLARAALASAALNVRANAGEVRDRDAARAWLAELSGLETRAADAFVAIERTLRERPSNA